MQLGASMVSSLYSPAPFVLGVLVPISPMEGLLLLKVLGLMEVHGCAEEQAGTAQVSERHHCAEMGGWLVMGCGWCPGRHPQKCCMNGCMGSEENKVTLRCQWWGRKLKIPGVSPLLSWL